MANNGYRMELRRHVEDVQRRFGDYNPTHFDMGLFDDDTLSDRALYFMTKLWRDATDRNYKSRIQNGAQGVQNNDEDRRMHLVLFKDGDGAYKMIDRYNYGRVVAVIKPGTDRLEFIGTKKDTSFFAGRQYGFNEIIKMAEDLDVLKDHPYKGRVK